MNTTNHTSPSGEELKPCPFCGCTTSPELKGNGIGDNWLECVECGASTRLREDGAGSAKDWNRRDTAIGEDAANGAIGEREAFEREIWERDRPNREKPPLYRNHENGIATTYLDPAVETEWQARAALAAEKVAAEQVAWFTDDSQSDRSATTWDRNVADRWRAKGWPVHPLYAAPQPAQTQVALTDDARECLADVVSHYRALYAGLAFQLNEATVTENADDMAYWKHEIKALERMYAQAERALLAAQPVSGGKS